MLNVDLIIKSIEKAGHTLNGIEKSLGWGNGSIKRWHTSSPSIDKLFALSNFLNVSVCTLIGELLALTEADFDFERGTVSITKNFQQVKGVPTISEPKTEKSKRSVPVPATVLQAVQDYIPRLYDYSPGDRLFPYTKEYFHHAMRRGSAASGVEYIRLHDLRHSHASLLIEMGVPILLVSERLGHEDIETTLRTYGHLYPNRHDETVALLDELISPTPEEEPSG